jgi:hypothetical protein
MTRRYRSRIEFDGPLGHNWDFTYNEGLVVLPGGDVERHVDDAQEARDSDGYPRISSPPCAELLKDLGDGHRAAASRAALRLGQREELPDAV